MALDEARTVSDSAADHVADHNILHTQHNVFTDTWIDALMRRPSDETPHAYDDEFDDETVDADWVELSIAGDMTVTEKRSRLSVLTDSTAGASDFQGVLKPLDSLTNPLTIETCFEVVSDDLSGSGMVGIGFSDGVVAGSNCAIGRTWRQGNIGIASGTLTSTDSVNNDTLATEPGRYARFYMRLIWSAANTFKIQVSIDGVSWTAYGLSATTKTMTPTHFGLLGTAYIGVRDTTASFDYFRVTESDLSV